jgi:GT2 family glycosyltransferase
MKVGFVFTNYNNSAYTAQLLESLAAIEQVQDTRVVVVDNASNGASRAELAAACARSANITLIQNEQNLGYFRGLNCGLRWLRRDFPGLDAVVIGNNDLVFPRDIVPRVLAQRALLERYPVLSPDIVASDGTHQNPHVIRPIGWRRELVYDIYYMNYPLARFLLALVRLAGPFARRTDHLQHAVGREIHQGYGACYVLGPLFLREFGELWAPTFLMGEEFFLSRQLAERNFALYYEPSITVRHVGHATTSTVPRREMWRIAKESHKVYRQYKARF